MTRPPTPVMGFGGNLSEGALRVGHCRLAATPANGVALPPQACQADHREPFSTPGRTPTMHSSRRTHLNYATTFMVHHENITPCLERIHGGRCLKSVSTYPYQSPATITERNPMFVNRLTRMIASGAVILAAGAITALPAGAAAHRSHHHAHHPSHHAGGGIPQHNGGDRDADNNGGPSDGDGNV